ncbi:hypothetical protein OSB04_019211 [Centaurea solstitialis]|uniref:Uncharacterized protein n=1 Tax=Centaurea solstitialis TaxID=347529 RepID=A0AA38T9E2_9ASTR|nr:hypothetical protein OSB04_019211 [Centaurea solstitialis]
MSRDLLSMGSKSKPPVLQIGEYPQWRVRMIQFLNNIDKTLMTSIQEGPIKPFIDIPGTPETATTPAIEPRRVYILFRHYNELEKIRAEIDDKALTFLTMAIPNDLFNRVDSRKTAKELWDELEKQFQGTERSIQAKLNQAIGAYEGFKALEGETLADSYSRFNIILNDLRRNGMQKSTSEINFKFLKNLNPEWDHYSVNLQMNKNLAEEDLHDLYSILSQHEVKVKDIVMKQKSISDSLALLTEKKSMLPSASSKKKSHSKALVTELSDSDSETLEDESSESDVDLKRVADKLALLSSSIHKRYGKKKFYSKPKFDNYKRDKYKPKDYERRPERKSYEKEKTDEKGNVCFNCGKPGHFVKDCRAPKVRDFDYYSKKAQLAKRKSEGKVLMAEEECWYDDTSDDEDSAHFTQVHYNLMASVEETINLHKQTEETNEVSQTPSDSDMSDNDECSLEEQFLILKAEFDDLKEKIKFERARVIEFSNECELYKSLADDRELEKAEIRKEKAKLESQISEMKSALVNLESEKAEYMIKYEVCFQDRSEAYAKIKQLEDLNIKRGQTQQTLKLLINNLKDTRFYNPKMGLGLPENDVLKKAPKGLYQFDNLSFPKLNETFVKSGSSLSDSSDKVSQKHKTKSKDVVAYLKQANLKGPNWRGHSVAFGGNQKRKIKGYGIIVKGEITVNQVSYVDGLKHNLISVSQLCDNGMDVMFKIKYCIMYKADTLIEVMRANRRGDLYLLCFETLEVKEEICLGLLRMRNMLWHPSVIEFSYLDNELKLLKNSTIEDYLTSAGITYNFSAPRTPQQNGMVERKNRTLIEAARTMLNASGLPLTFWAEAVSTACYTQNRSLVVKHFEKTPYQLLYNKRPNIKFFHVFRCKCYVLNDREPAGKFDPKGDDAIFVGYAGDSLAYRV